MIQKNALLEKVAFDFPVQVLKTVEADGEFHIVGYAATTDFDLQGDIITEEALQASSLDLLKNSTVLLNHDLKQPIGKVTKVQFDRHGLLIDALISKTEPDIIQKIKEGVLNKFSIRGQVLERERKFLPEYNRNVNVIKRMALVEVSLVSVPANPEAKAIGWYISKALENMDEKLKGGDTMPEDQMIVEEISPEVAAPAPEPGADHPEPQPAAADKPASTDAGKPADEPAKEPASQPPAPSETQKQMSDALKPQLEPVFFLLDKLVAIGGPGEPIAQQIKAMLKHMAGDTSYPYPSAYPYPKAVSKADLGKMIAEEVTKQVDAAVKAAPALRKGLIQPEPDADEVKKQFESLSPEKKLKVALALRDK